MTANVIANVPTNVTAEVSSNTTPASPSRESRATHPFVVRKVAVLGAGVMGAQIAAHLINARVPVVLFDLATPDASSSDTVPPERARSTIALQAIERLKKLKPAPFAFDDDAKYLRAANYDDDLLELAECDLVIEAIAERLDWKHALYRRVGAALGPHTLFATNTSGLSITALSEGFDAGLKARFCGVHFFNPPRYMHLVELIPTAHTDPGMLDQLETFLTGTLGKGVVRAKDTPNFIANRVGIFSMLAVMARAGQYGLSFDAVDDLTGARLGRAKSATFRTADVVGLDTMGHVIKTMQDGLKDDPFSMTYATPPVLQRLIGAGALGQKSGAGFYKKVGKEILVLDPAATDPHHAYVAGSAKADDLIVRILKRPAAERLRLLRETDHPQAQFLWSVLRDVFHYVAVHLAAIAHSARDVDFALRWGFGWTEGPFEIWQAAGWRDVASWIAEDIENGRALSAAPLPEWAVSGPVAERGGVHQPEGSYSPADRTFVSRAALPVYEMQVFRAPLFGGGDAQKALSSASGTASHSAAQSDPATRGETLYENEGARIWTDPAAGAGDVVVVSFRSKMNTIGPEVLDALQRAVTVAESGYKGLVVWQPTSLKLGTPGGPFSAGANLAAAMPMMMSGGAAAVEPFIVSFQQTMMRLKYAQVPVVAALSGIALGGGCELALHAARRVAHIETFLGLVEIGVGLVPAGGGLKEGAIAAANAAAQYDSARYLDFLLPRFMSAAKAQVSTSAYEARHMGYLTPSDPIVFNVHALLHTARETVRAMWVAGYRAPLPATAIPVAGRSAIATLRGQLVNMRDGGFISDHDFLIACRIAETLCGGDVEPGTRVDEAWLLTLERRAFVELLGTTKTQERIMGLLNGGKPPRN